MDADEFYEAFKESLGFLGLKWGQKDLATVFIKDGAFWMRYGSRTVRLEFPVTQELGGV